jgi:starch-binding outer membrane protein, SusD/RagB family
MKGKLMFVLLVITLVLPTSCSDWLDEVPLTTITEANFYNSNQDLFEAGGGLHAGFTNVLRNNYHRLGDLTADQISTGPAADAPQISLDLYTFDRFETGFVRLYWQDNYKIINNANTLLQKALTAASASAASKKRALGEAYFFRAYAYYTLTRLFKDVPIVNTVPAELYPSRSPQAEVYKLIIADLKLAAGETDPNVALPSSLGSASENGRVLVGAALGTLAEVYLTTKDWKNAALYAQKVIDLNRYALWPNYGDNYFFPNKYKANSAPLGESILAGQHHQDVGIQNRITRDCTPANVLLGLDMPRTGLDYFVVKTEVYNTFNAADARRAHIFPATYPNSANVQTPWPATPGRVYMYKYRWEGQPSGPPTFGLSHNNDVLRYADILLIKAEALNEDGGPSAEAYSAINQVRTRAKLPALSGLSQATFREAVADERKFEFFLEGHRFYDLKRTGKWFEVMSKLIPTLTPDKEYFPIPQTEMDLNKNLTQNPGW